MFGFIIEIASITSNRILGFRELTEDKLGKLREDNLGWLLLERKERLII